MDPKRAIQNRQTTERVKYLLHKANLVRAKENDRMKISPRGRAKASIMAVPLHTYSEQ